MEIDRLRLAVASEAGAAAHALTVKAIRRTTIPLRKLADDVTAAVEARIEHLFATSGLAEVACRTGCAYCCFVPRVLVTLPELARIVEYVRQWPIDQIASLKVRLDAHILAQSSDVASPALRPPCPLLVGQSCSVYDARPLVCHAQHAFDARECQSICETGAGETTQLTVVLDVVQGAASGVATAFHDMGMRADLFDLSRALLLALDNPKILAQGTSGLSSLASAMVTTDIKRA